MAQTPITDPEDAAPRTPAVAELVDALGSIDERLGTALDDLSAAPLGRVPIDRSQHAALVVREAVHELVQLCAGASLPTAPSSGDLGEHPLSPREHEVADLVAVGLSNADIAGRLFISKRTVESHMENIKHKLGFRTRHQVMAWTLRRDLTLHPEQRAI